jgi:CheY-like chemotaxis protein
VSALGAGRDEARRARPPVAAPLPQRVRDAIAALLEAAERLQPGLQAALHWPERGVLRTLARGSAAAALCDALDALDELRNPALCALQDGSAMQIDLADDGAAALRWPDCAALLRAHRLSACRALPLLDGHGQPLAVWMLYAGPAPRPTLTDPGVDALARTSALLIEQAVRQQQRDQEGQQRRDALRVLAHDLRNLLAPLRTALEVLSRPQTAAAPLQRLQTIMTRQLAQLAAVPDELSRLARTGDDDGAADDAQLSLPTGEPPTTALNPGEPRGPHAMPAAAAAAGDQRADGAAAAPSANAPAHLAPATPAAADGSSPSAQPEADMPRRVLVADDNELVRASFVELLAAEGFEVRTAADGVQAVEIADQWHPDVVLLDIHMPRLSGLETARRLRAAHPPQAMKLLMLSGMSLNDAWLRHAKAAGFDDCLDKSADPRAWLARLRTRGAPH